MYLLWSLHSSCGSIAEPVFASRCAVGCESTSDEHLGGTRASLAPVPLSHIRPISSAEHLSELRLQLSSYNLDAP